MAVPVGIMRAAAMPSPTYTRLNAIGTTTINPCRQLVGVMINAIGTSMTVALWDNTSAVAPEVAAITGITAPIFYYYAGAYLTNGALTVVIAGTTAGDITVLTL